MLGVDSKARGPAATRGLDGCVVERPGERAVGGRGILCVPRMALDLQTSSAHGSTCHFLHGICHCHHLQCLVPLQVTGGCVLPSNTALVPKTSWHKAKTASKLTLACLSRLRVEGRQGGRGHQCTSESNAKAGVAGECFA